VLTSGSDVWLHCFKNISSVFPSENLMHAFARRRGNKTRVVLAIKSIQKKISKLNSNLFEKQNRPKDHKKYACHAIHPLKLFKLSYCYFGENALS
jgi:hypothetical protein